MKNSSRRQFIRNAGLGASALGLTSLSNPEQQTSQAMRPLDRLPREELLVYLFGKNGVLKYKGSSPFTSSQEIRSISNIISDT